MSALQLREIHVHREGARLFAVEAGRGPAVVMQHGGLANHQAALPLVAELADRFRIVAPDLRGSGRSWYSAELTFDLLADDLAALLDHLEIECAIVGGISTGSGVALRFALRHPDRTRGLVVVKPVHAGAQVGYTEPQRSTFARMDALASRALDEGVQVLQPLYASLPENIRDHALAMAAAFDAASVVATSRFMASDAQPFSTSAELATLPMPALLVRGDDPMHPGEVSDQYAETIPQCTVLPASTIAIAAAVAAFAQRLA